MSETPVSETPPPERQLTRVSAYALCRDEADRMLLVRIAPGFWGGAGEWTVPGGGLDFGEPPTAGALRELEEETGLRGEIIGLAEVGSHSGRWTHPRDGVDEAYHGIQVFYRVRVTGGELRNEVGGSTDLAGWFTRTEAEALPLVELARIGLALVFDAPAG